MSFNTNHSPLTTNSDTNPKQPPGNLTIVPNRPEAPADTISTTILVCPSTPCGNWRYAPLDELPSGCTLCTSGRPLIVHVLSADPDDMNDLCMTYGPYALDALDVDVSMDVTSEQPSESSTETEGLDLQAANIDPVISNEEMQAILAQVDQMGQSSSPKNMSENAAETAAWSMDWPAPEPCKDWKDMTKAERRNAAKRDRNFSIIMDDNSIVATNRMTGLSWEIRKGDPLNLYEDVMKSQTEHNGRELDMIMETMASDQFAVDTPADVDGIVAMMEEDSVMSDKSVTTSDSFSGSQAPSNGQLKAILDSMDGKHFPVLSPEDVSGLIAILEAEQGEDSSMSDDPFIVSPARSTSPARHAK